MQRDYASASTAIQALTNELAGLRLSRVHLVPKPHHGKSYEDLISYFVEYTHKLEKQFDVRFWETAAVITAVAEMGITPIDNVNRLWHRLAKAITHVSPHPNKPVATIAVGADERMKAFGINRVPPKIKTSPKHYLAGTRKNFIVCSERMCIANLMNYTIKPYRSRRGQQLNITSQQVRHLTDHMKVIGPHTSELHDSKLISTVTPCMLCAEVIVAFHPKAVYSGMAGSHFKRQDTFASAQVRMTESGIKVWQLGP